MKPIALIALLALLVGCQERTPEGCPEQFAKGDLVAMKIDGRKGQVLYVSGCNVGIRVPVNVSPTGVASKHAYESIYVHGFEVEKVR